MPARTKIITSIVTVLLIFALAIARPWEYGLAALCPASETEDFARTLKDGLAAYESDDYAKARRLLMPLARRHDASALNVIGDMYRDGKGVAKSPRIAHIYTREAAFRGSAESQYKLSFSQSPVYDRLPADPYKQKHWLHEAAKQGYDEAQLDLSRMYSSLEENVLALYWLRKAAEQGHTYAQLELAEKYSKGDGELQDAAMAAKWYSKAANGGLDDPAITAQAHLGLLYEEGTGVPKDYVLAHMWYNLAADGGNYYAVDMLRDRDRVAAKMTPAQIAEALRLWSEWKPEIEYNQNKEEPKPNIFLRLCML
ncbi:MAG: tetratricopeptide repeat protein [Pseudomonadota bacterium]